MASVMPGTPGYQPGTGNPIARPARPRVSGPITPGGPGNLPPRGVGRGISPTGPGNMPPPRVSGPITPGGPGNLPPRPPRLGPPLTPPGPPNLPPNTPRGPITPSGPGNLPPRFISPPGIPPVPRVAPPVAPPIVSHGFDPNVYRRGLSGTALKDFTSLMRNTGGNFKNFGGGGGIAANLNRRYGLPQAQPNPQNPLFMELMNRGRG